MTKVIKAGCILINFSDKKAGLIYRTKQNDYSFPKGHVEEGETVMECAIRETKEETSRLPEILCELQIDTYTDSEGNETEVTWFLARDLCPVHEEISEDLKHEVVWTDLDKVNDTLSYGNLKNVWNNSQEKINFYLNELG